MKIVADTSTLLTPEEGRELGISVIPVGVVVNEKVYRDMEEITAEQFLEFVKEGAIPTSSQPTIGDVLDIFEDTEEEILYLAIGDGLSGAYQNAVGAKNSLEKNEHIHIMDTKTLAGPERYLVRKAAQLRDSGFDMPHIKEELRRLIETSVSFVIPADFNFLKRSGRLTSIAASIGSLIKIVPVMTQTEDMKRITPFAIKRSRKKAVAAIMEHLKKIGVNDEYLISISHGGAYGHAKEVFDLMKDQFRNATIELFQLSPALITHGGPGCIVIQAIRK